MASKLEKLQDYARKISESEYHITSTVGKASYETSLDRTLKELEARLENEKAILSEVSLCHVHDHK